MDFQPKIKYILPTGTPIPYFMLDRTVDDGETLNGYLFRKPSDFVTGRGADAAHGEAYEDFEYLQRTYPTMLNRYQKRVAEIMDTMDYEGSMIYDEFPDKLSLLDLGSAVARILADMDRGMPLEKGTRELLPKKEQNVRSELRKNGVSREGTELGGMEEAYLQGLAQVLVCNEIYRRRRSRRKQGG